MAGMASPSGGAFLLPRCTPWSCPPFRWAFIVPARAHNIHWEGRMAENEAPQGADDATQDESEVKSADTDWKAEARKWESRAKENLSTAKANEAAAKQLRELEDSQKSDAQKQAEELASARAELAEMTAAKTRAEVAATKGVPANLLTGSTQEDLEASADALLAWRPDQGGSQRLVPNTWDRPSSNISVADQFANWSDSTFN